MDILKTSNKRFFGILITSGWLLYSALNFTLFFIITKTEFQTITGFAIKNLLGFLLTFGLLKLILKTDMLKIPFRVLIIKVAGISFLIANIWTLSVLFLKGYLENNLMVNNLVSVSIVRYLSSFYWDFTLIMIWGFLFSLILLWKANSLQKIREHESYLLYQKAQLKLLRHQINPHFLFNSLNSIRALIRENEEIAISMISEFTDYLRYSFDAEKKEIVLLREEIESIEKYLSIEKKMYEEKLCFKLEVDEALKEIKVLSFILHPQVENAVKYGMKTSKMPLRIFIEVKYSDELNVSLKVLNSGGLYKQNIVTTSAMSLGLGLKNVKQRLEHTYGNRHTFRISEFEQEGEKYVEVTIKINKECFV